jgi:hypothetical protein
MGKGLDNAHAPVVEVGGVVVVGDLALGLAGGDAERGGLEGVDGRVEGVGRLVAGELHVLQVAGVAAAAVGEGVAVGGAVGVRGGDEDVLRGDARGLGADAVAEDRRDAEDVEDDDGDGRVAFAQDQRTGGEVAALLLGRLGQPEAAGDGQ